MFDVRRQLIYIILLGLIALASAILMYHLIFVKPKQALVTIGDLTIPRDIYDVIKDSKKVITVSSPAFTHGGTIPKKYTCVGDNISLPINITTVPSNARSLIIIMYDPDAPRGVFYHWLLYNIPPDIGFLPEGIPNKGITRYGVQGINDFGVIGYGGPCPPPGDVAHRYYILVIAIDKKLDLGPGVDVKTLVDEIRGHVVGYGYLMGLFKR